MNNGEMSEFGIKFADEKGLEALVTLVAVTSPDRLRTVQSIPGLEQQFAGLATPAKIGKLVLGEAQMSDPLGKVKIYLEPDRSSEGKEVGYVLKAGLSPTDGKKLSIDSAAFAGAFETQEHLGGHAYFLGSELLPVYNPINLDMLPVFNHNGIDLSVPLYNVTATYSPEEYSLFTLGEMHRGLANVKSYYEKADPVIARLNLEHKVEDTEIDALKQEADSLDKTTNRLRRILQPHQSLDDEMVKNVVNEFVKAVGIAVKAVYISAGVNPPNQTMYLSFANREATVQTNMGRGEQK